MEQCKENGAGSCNRCIEKGKWSNTWMTLLYKVEGYDGCYCYECAKELEELKNVRKEENDRAR